MLADLQQPPVRPRPSLISAPPEDSKELSGEDERGIVDGDGQMQTGGRAVAVAAVEPE